MRVLKSTVPTALALTAGVFVLASVFTTNKLLDDMGTYFIDMAVIIAAFALFLGMLNIVRVHARKLRERKSGWPYSLVLVAAMLIVLALGLPIVSGQPSGPTQPTIQWIFENIQAPMQASFGALLVFFVVTAAYRLLRVRSLESAVMLVVTLLVLAGQVALGLVPVLSDVKDWILDVPTMAGVRGILLGVALGAILTGFRLLLGFERPYSD